MDLQLFGLGCPPFYYVEDAVEIIKKIAVVDEKMNELAIEREKYVADLEEEIKKINSKKD